MHRFSHTGNTVSIYLRYLAQPGRLVPHPKSGSIDDHLETVRPRCLGVVGSPKKYLDGRTGYVRKAMNRQARRKRDRHEAEFVSVIGTDKPATRHRDRKSGFSYCLGHSPGRQPGLSYLSKILQETVALLVEIAAVTDQLQKHRFWQHLNVRNI